MPVSRAPPKKFPNLCNAPGFGGSIFLNLPFATNLLNFCCALATFPPLFSSSFKNTLAASSPRSLNIFLYADSAVSPNLSATVDAFGLLLGPSTSGSAPLGFVGVGFFGFFGFGSGSGTTSATSSAAVKRSLTKFTAASVAPIPPIAKAIFPNASKRSSKVDSLPKRKSRPVPMALPIAVPNSHNLSKTNFAFSKNSFNFTLLSSSAAHSRTAFVRASPPSCNKKLPIGAKNFSIQLRPPLAILFNFPPGFFFTLPKSGDCSTACSVEASNSLLSLRRSAFALASSSFI